MLKFSKYFVGILFIISGIIKLNDPVGFSIKLEEYFVVFGTTFLNPMVLGLSIFICALEVVLGVALLFNLRTNATAWMLLLLIIFFTFLTGYSAVSGKVTDCGCFGDAIKLTPWQSFTKDLILLFFIVIIFINRTKTIPILSLKNQKVAFLLSGAVALLFGIYCVVFLPVVDFLPYKIGNNIPELMKLPENAIKDSFETIMYYQKGDSVKGFGLTNYPWQDSTWKWLKTENKIIREGDKPKIKDFRISDADGNDYTEDMLTFPDVQVWIISYNISSTKNSDWEKINNLTQQLDSVYKIKTIGLTASSSEETEFTRHESNLGFPFYYCDATTLKTIVRANPAVLIIKKGVIINKWSMSSLPSFSKIMNTISN